MTAYAIDFRRDRIQVACDSLAYAPDGDRIRPLGSIAKVFALPHLRGALLGRGMMLIVWIAGARLLQRPDIVTIEDAAALLPAELARATDEYAKTANLAGDWRKMMLMEAVLCGWSERDGRMKLYTFNNYENYAPQEDGGAFYGVLTLPNLEALMPTVAGPFEAQIVAIFQAFRRLFLKHPTAGAVGGDVHFWNFDKTGMSQRVVWRFPDAERLQSEGAALVSGMLAGEESVDVAAGLARNTADKAVTIGDLEPTDAARQRAADDKRRRREERNRRNDGSTRQTG